ncbi:MAG TPA: UDP-N-acetylmuramoyl-L-alanine--D-glutamate ligase [Burkholderiales bacterium]|nr:UDP-N-acetylmuramoyl-L-alanine--D-glutamate ligase [Burkholderiales bacterium]
MGAGLDARHLGWAVRTGRLDLNGKHAMVLGLGDTGLSMARWLTRRGAAVRVADSRATPPRAAELAQVLPHAALETGAFRDASFEAADLVAISPGISVREPAVARARARGVPVWGDIELFAQAVQAQGRPRILAITGTNGKTTVTSMTGALCRAAGLDACVAGNIAPPVLDALMAREDAGTSPDVWVIELSSFQLETTYSLNATAAVVLNLTQDHCDRYRGMEDYAAAKSRVFNGTGVQVVNRDDPYSRSMAKSGRPTFSFGLGEPERKGEWGIVEHGGRAWLAENGDRLMALDDLQVAGLQNAANALAALALCRAIDLPYPLLTDGLRAFRGLPHRVQRVAEIDGVRFFDDSKGTNVGATVAALEGLGRPAVLIAGGEGKGQDFAPLAPAVAAHARAVVLIGRDGPAIGRALAGCGVPTLAAASLPAAVELAFGLARRGDAVLLSPACASFDMFRNYEHRAEVFVAAVHALEGAR